MMKDQVLEIIKRNKKYVTKLYNKSSNSPIQKLKIRNNREKARQ